MNLLASALLLAAAFVSAPQLEAKAAEPPFVEQFLLKGELAEGEVALLERLKLDKDNSQLRFELGTLQFLRAIEGLGQSLYRHGRQKQSQWIPFLRIPLPENPEPEEISYRKVRHIFLNMQAELTRAEANLSRVTDRAVMQRLHFGRIRLDLNGDGATSEDEVLWRIFTTMNRGARITEDMAGRFVIAFDHADAIWLRGYCHLLLSMTDIILAHDFQDAFERTAQLYFPKVDSPYGYLRTSPSSRTWFGSDTDIADGIAMIHMIRYECTEPKRMMSALHHFEEVVRLSRLNWDAIQAEIDDDAEWIPNPKQTGVIPNVRVSPEMIDAWKAFLDEMDAILKGKKLLAHWRIGNDGINLRRIFTEPTKLDLVLWLQGTAAKPYIEKGELTDQRVWRQLQQVFSGQFFGFAIWFN